MATASAVEPFPAISSETSPVTIQERPAIRRRATSRSLPGEPRGDTGAPSLASYATTNPPDHKSTREKGKKRRKAKTIVRRYINFSLRNTWFNPLLVLIILLAAYYRDPGEHNPLHKAIFLSYPGKNAPSGPAGMPLHYGKGNKDLAFIGFYTIFFSFTREFLMQCFIRPVAIHLGIRSRAKLARFMEQAYTAIYFGVFGPYGLYVMSRSPVWYFNTTAMFEGFPHRSHEAVFKAYYLLQAAYWAQQAIVLMLQLEKPRKDFKELVGHHIITLSLIWCSYRFHFGYTGIAVYITHDISDFFLATSKILNYLDSPITVPYFAFFMAVWAYCRHYINIRLLWAVLTEFRTVGPYALNWDTQQYKCWISQVVTFGLLASLQAVNLFWFFLICRIAKRAVFAGDKRDDRSEYGSDDEDIDGETTASKRKRMGLPPSEEHPVVLVNGVPVDEASTHVPSKSKGSRKSK